MKSVAIIGGGITGLTAAFRLKQRGLKVTVYEAGKRVGGVIQSVREDGYLAEFGPNTILETSPKIGELIRDLKLEERKMYSDPRAERRYIVRGGEPVPVPGSPVDFLKTGLFSWRSKTHLIAEPFIRRAPAEAEENLEQFVLRRLGREFLDYAINPFVAGVYAGDPARLSVKHAFPKLHALEQKYGSLIRGQILGARERKRRGEVSKQSAKKLSFDLGLQVLIDALAEKLSGDIQLETPVTEIEKTGTGWRIHTVKGTEEHDCILMAAPAYKLARINLHSPAGTLLATLGNVKYPPVKSLVFGFRREDVAHPLDGFGVLVPEVEKMNILGVIFSSSLFPHRAPAGYVTLTIYVGGSRNPCLAATDHQVVRKLVLDDMAKLLGVCGRPTFEHSATFMHAIPQYEVGYERFKKVMSEIETQSPGLFFAGPSRDGISLSDSIVSGDNAALRIVAASCLREETKQPADGTPVPSKTANSEQTTVTSV